MKITNQGRAARFAYDKAGGRVLFPAGQTVDADLSKAELDGLKGYPGIVGGSAPAEPEARHKGRGSYSVMAGDAEVVEGLTKDEADSFNALDASAKADFVASRQA